MKSSNLINALAILPIQILLWGAIFYSLDELEVGIASILFMLYMIFASIIGVKELISSFTK